jgi:hypothetical protein
VKGRVVVVAGGGLREDEKKAARERETPAEGRTVRRGRVTGNDGGGGGGGGGGGVGAGGLRRAEGTGRRDARTPRVGDEVSRTWSRTSREPTVRGMKRLRERDVGQILFPPTSD